MQRKKLFCCFLVLIMLMLSLSAFATETAAPDAAAVATEPATDTIAPPATDAGTMQERPSRQAPDGQMPGGRGQNRPMQPPAGDSGFTPQADGGMPNSGGAQPANTDANTAPQAPPEMTQPDENAADTGTQPDGAMPEDMQGGMMPGFGRGQGGMMPQEDDAAVGVPNSLLRTLEEYFTPICAGVMLIAGFVFVIFYKRKKY